MYIKIVEPSNSPLSGENLFKNMTHQNLWMSLKILGVSICDNYSFSYFEFIGYCARPLSHDKVNDKQIKTEVVVLLV